MPSKTPRQARLPMGSRRAGLELDVHGHGCNLTPMCVQSSLSMDEHCPSWCLISGVLLQSCQDLEPVLAANFHWALSILVQRPDRASLKHQHDVFVTTSHPTNLKGNPGFDYMSSAVFGTDYSGRTCGVETTQCRRRNLKDRQRWRFVSALNISNFARTGFENEDFLHKNSLTAWDTACLGMYGKGERQISSAPLDSHEKPLQATSTRFSFSIGAKVPQRMLETPAPDMSGPYNFKPILDVSKSPSSPPPQDLPSIVGSAHFETFCTSIGNQFVSSPTFIPCQCVRDWRTLPCHRVELAIMTMRHCNKIG